MLVQEDFRRMVRWHFWMRCPKGLKPYYVSERGRAYPYFTKATTVARMDKPGVWVEKEPLGIWWMEFPLAIMGWLESRLGGIRMLIVLALAFTLSVFAFGFICGYLVA